MCSWLASKQVHLVPREDLPQSFALRVVVLRCSVGKEVVGPRRNVHRHDQVADAVCLSGVRREVLIEPGEKGIRQGSRGVVHDREVRVLVREGIGGPGKAEEPGELLRGSPLQFVVPDHEEQRFRKPLRPLAERLPGGGPPGPLQVPRVEKELHVGLLHGREDSGEHPVAVVPAVPADAERPAEGAVAGQQEDQQERKKIFPAHRRIVPHTRPIPAFPGSVRRDVRGAGGYSILRSSGNFPITSRLAARLAAPAIASAVVADVAEASSPTRRPPTRMSPRNRNT